jgi:3-oxoacyl-[acyl-carrier-protein] synthase-3
MGAVILATAVSADRSIRSSIAHAGVATRACVEAAKLSLSDVGVLVNVGVYRDSNMAEPAMAALIQKEAGVNPDFMQTGVASTSFDLMNGACGALNAVQVAGALLSTGTARQVVIVSSDAHPSNQEVEGFPYATMGAAMLLGASDDPTRGFGPLRTLPLEQGDPGVEGYVPWMTGARGIVSVDVHPQFAARALEAATRLARDYVASEKLDLAKTFLVSSHPTPTFAKELAKNLGVAPDAVATVDGIEKDPHSSALTWGYDRAIARGLDARYETVLFVAVGAGISAACTAYRR